MSGKAEESSGEPRKTEDSSYFEEFDLENFLEGFENTDDTSINSILARKNPGPIKSDDLIMRSELDPYDDRVTCEAVRLLEEAEKGELSWDRMAQKLLEYGEYDETDPAIITYVGIILDVKIPLVEGIEYDAGSMTYKNVPD